LVPPPGYDPGSSDFQSVAMTTSAKAANTYLNTPATVKGQCRGLSPKVYNPSFTDVFNWQRITESNRHLFITSGTPFQDA